MPLDCPEVVLAGSPGDSGASLIGQLSYEALAADSSPLRTALQLLGRLAPTSDTKGGPAQVASPAGLVLPVDKVVVKPNWVMHRNRSEHGLECLVTHAMVLAAVVDWVLAQNPRSLVVGDAPVQGCDFEALMLAAGYHRLRERLRGSHPSVRWQDFRRAVLRQSGLLAAEREEVRPQQDYLLFDLGRDSLLEPISKDSDRFRVTMYNPDVMRETHRPGRHQYLVAHDVIEADVVINLPKLKTHAKAGLTGALKNLVGINGNKDYLPHHRAGGAGAGGDCYPGRSRLKQTAESLADAWNRRTGWGAFTLRQAYRGACALARVADGDDNMEGSWYGNDTVWRMCLDLNRILLYGRPDGTLADSPQRRLLHVTDAIVCGEGEGPLAPAPHPLGLLTVALNPVAADFVHAHLMGLDWHKIPLIREAFGQFRYPIATFRPEDVVFHAAGSAKRQPWTAWPARPFRPPAGWRGHCEKT